MSGDKIAWNFLIIKAKGISNQQKVVIASKATQDKYDHNGLKVSWLSSDMMVCRKNITIVLLSRVASLSCTSAYTSMKNLKDDT